MSVGNGLVVGDGVAGLAIDEQEFATAIWHEGVSSGTRLRFTVFTHAHNNSCGCTGCSNTRSWRDRNGSAELHCLHLIAVVAVIAMTTLIAAIVP